MASLWSGINQRKVESVGTDYRQHPLLNEEGSTEQPGTLGF